MRIGIFSDVHANLEAMSAVMEAYACENIDIYYCLGDVVGYGGSPNECADIVRELAEVTILGNHDAAVAGRMDYSYYYEAAREALDLHAHMVTKDLFQKYHSAADYADADPEVFEQEIKSTGFFRNKTKSVLGMAQALVSDHGSAERSRKAATSGLLNSSLSSTLILASMAFTSPSGVEMRGLISAIDAPAMTKAS